MFQDKLKITFESCCFHFTRNLNNNKKDMMLIKFKTDYDLFYSSD